MKTQNVLLLLLMTCIGSVAVTYLAVRPPHPASRPTEAEVASYPLPSAAVPTVPQAAPAPAITKERILALFASESQAHRKKNLESIVRAVQDVPPFAGAGTRGYPVTVAMEGKYEKAQELAQKWISDYPDAADAYYMQAWIYARIGEYDRAMKVCSDRLINGADYNKLRYLQIWVYGRQQQYEQALKVCDEALKTEPSSAGLMYAKGRILDVLGRSDEAIQSYSRAIELKTDFADVYLYRGLLYTVLGRYEQAISDQKEFVRLNKYDPAGYLGLGLVYDQVGDYQQAMEQMKNAVMLGSMGARTTEAKMPLTASVGINDALIYNKIGILNIKLGQYDAARAAFHDSIVTGSLTPDAYRGLSLTYLLLGDKDAAIENYNILKKLDPEGAAAVAELIKP